MAQNSFRILHLGSHFRCFYSFLKSRIDKKRTNKKVGNRQEMAKKSWLRMNKWAQNWSKIVFAHFLMTFVCLDFKQMLSTTFCYCSKQLKIAPFKKRFDHRQIDFLWPQKCAFKIKVFTSRRAAKNHTKMESFVTHKFKRISFEFLTQLWFTVH